MPGATTRREGSESKPGRPSLLERIPR
jgi:hypothetical protein